MKRTVVLLLYFAVLLGLCSCASDSPNSGILAYEDEAGNSVIKSEGYTTTFYDSLPAALKYNAKEVFLSDVQTYEMKSGYSYNLFIVATVDVSKLNDTERHWFTESDWDAAVYITDEKNGYDFDRATMLGSLLSMNKKKITFVATSSFAKENRYSFADAEITVTMMASQEETYQYTNSQGETSALHLKESIHYDMVVPEDMQTPDEGIKEPLKQQVKDWLLDRNIKILESLVSGSGK